MVPSAAEWLYQVKPLGTWYIPRSAVETLWLLQLSHRSVMQPRFFARDVTNSGDSPLQIDLVGQLIAKLDPGLDSEVSTGRHGSFCFFTMSTRFSLCALRYLPQPP